MDLSPRVSRALRSTDGVIVVVDAVEGCQIQTEIVLKQALKERVRPTLYINKVDRLINELKLNPEQIQARFQKIIEDFNDLIESNADELFQESWKINIQQGNVVFGSAIYPSWGFSYERLLSQKMKFKHIYEVYDSPNKSDDLVQLSKKLPLSEAIFEMIINCLPDPVEAQRYRIPKIWKGLESTRMAEFLRVCDENGPPILCLNKIMVDKHGGYICIGRLFSGQISRGISLYALNKKTSIKIREAYLFMGEQKQRIERISCGNIVAFKTMTEINAGETLVQEGYEEKMSPFEYFQYLTDPILTIALEPKQPSKLDKMLDILNKMALNDPSLKVFTNRDTGEYLISGLGELHLDIIIKDIEHEGLEVISSNPLVVFREGITQASSSMSSKSKNGLNLIQLKILPLNSEEEKLISEGKFKEFDNLLYIEPHLNLVFDKTEEGIHGTHLKNILIEGFKLALKAGPLCDEPVRGLKLIIEDLKLDSKPANRTPLDLQLMVRNIVFACILAGSPILFEPISKLIIQLPLTLIKIVETLAAQKKGKIMSIEQIGSSSFITCLIPIKDSLDLTRDLRSKSSGQAFWQVFFSHWQQMTPIESNSTIQNIRLRKGRSPQIPSSDFFLKT